MTNDIVSHHYENQLKDEGDLEKIKDMEITRDEQADALHAQEASEIFDGVGPVRFTGFIFHLGLWDHLSQYMGVENIYFDLMDRPEFLLSAMERMTVSTIRGIEQANRLGLHDDNANLCHCSHIYTDELLPDSGAGKGSVSKNCWAYGMAQLFSSVSPRRHRGVRDSLHHQNGGAFRHDLLWLL